MIRKILVPLDGSPAGEAVLPWVQQIAKAAGAHVNLLASVYEIGQWHKIPVLDIEARRRKRKDILRPHVHSCHTCSVPI
jgi:hypothetical protein